MQTRLYGTGIAPAPYTATQHHSHRFMTNVIEARADEEELDRALLYLDAIHESCGIARRYSAIEDFTRDDPGEFTFFPKRWDLEPVPSTAQRMKIYEPVSVAMAEMAAREAMVDADVSAAEITHLVVVTCTGLFAPGPDILLTRRLGLSPGTQRTIIGFMGCYGAFNGIRAAHQIIASDPNAVVLQVCVELCSLHFQTELEPHVIIGNCLFADGAAATVWAGGDRLRGGYADLVTSRCYVTGDSLDQMQWHIGDQGFTMILDVEVPRTLRAGGARFVDGLLDAAEMNRDDVGAWLVHPGGPKIVDAVRDAVGLDEEEVALSRSVLRDFGNMSSSTFLFVLHRHLQHGDDDGPMALLGFGPGLTLEGAILEPV
jgi:alpha-pyrone synthase